MHQKLKLWRKSSSTEWTKAQSMMTSSLLRNLFGHGIFHFPWESWLFVWLERKCCNNINISRLTYCHKDFIDCHPSLRRHFSKYQPIVFCKGSSILKSNWELNAAFREESQQTNDDTQDHSNFFVYPSSIGLSVSFLVCLSVHLNVTFLAYCEISPAVFVFKLIFLIWREFLHEYSLMHSEEFWLHMDCDGVCSFWSQLGPVSCTASP